MMQYIKNLFSFVQILFYDDLIIFCDNFLKKFNLFHKNL